MGETLEAPPDFHDLLRAPNTAVLSTVLPDGSLQGSPVWTAPGFDDTSWLL